MKICKCDYNKVNFGISAQKTTGVVVETTKKVFPKIEDFYTKGEPRVVPAKVEEGINKFIEQYSQVIEKKSAEAAEASKHIHLNA